MTAEDDLRRFCHEIVQAENAHASALDGDAAREARQRRLPEVEFAARLRARFTDLDTFLNAQGRGSERDLVSDAHTFELEVKYFANATPQGGAVPVADWKWLVGEEPRTPVREGYSRYWWVLFPRAALGYGSRGRGNAAAKVPGSWNFQDCLSFTPTPTCNYVPFLPFAEQVVPLGARGKKLKPVLRFRERTIPRSILPTTNGVTVRADMMGDPHKDSVWAVFYALVSADSEPLLADHERLLLPIAPGAGWKP